jgi:hypothetical protein
MAIMIGKAHPVLNAMKGMQNYTVQFNQSFFDGLYYLKTPTPLQKTTWRTGAMTYSVYTEANIPFLLINFTKEKWTFITPLNAYTASESERTEWISSTEKVLNLFLLNADTNITEEIRTLRTDAQFSTLVRNACKAQLAQYKSAAEVQTAIQKTMQTRTFAQMQQAAYTVTVMTI